MFAFLPPEADLSSAITSQYNYGLVFLSYVIACAAAYTSWNMADRIRESVGRFRKSWLLGGACAMGIGVWAMHFIGMLAFKLPLPVSYDLITTLLSVIPAILASAVVIRQISIIAPSNFQIFKSGTLMGLGIGCMHYLGMAAMQLPAKMYYQPEVFILSVIVAVALATLAIATKVWAVQYKEHRNQQYYRLISILVMGLAVAGMHYTAMAAVVYFPDPSYSQLTSVSIEPLFLSAIVFVVVFIVLFFTALSSIWGKRLNQAKISLQAYTLANELKDDFISTISHELLTPINGISLSLDLIKPHLNKSGNEYFETATQSSLHLQHLIENLILFNEARRGDIKLQSNFINLKKTIFSQAKNLANNSDIEVNTTFDNEVPEWILGDQKLISLVINELLKNANCYSRNSQVSIFCECESIDKDTYRLTINVKDSGIGIKEQMHAQIFRAFQSNSSMSSNIGVGLILCNELLKLLHGDISLNDDDENGSSFSIHFPITKATASQIKTHVDSQNKEQVAAFTAKNSKVLVVEDNNVNMLLLLKVLKNLNYQTLSATDGKMAIEILEKNKDIALILMDCQMPVMDGYQATEKIRQMKNYRNLPIIAVTANISQRDRKRCMDAGMNDFLGKPVTPSLIDRTISKWVSFE